MAKPAGVYRVALNDVDYGTKVLEDFEPGGEKKTTQYASGRRTGASSEPDCCKLTVVFENTNDTDYEAIARFTEGTITVSNDIGQVWTVPKADIMASPKILPNGGGMRCMFEGDPAQLAP